ncbi:Methyltransferase domain family protein [Aspergillus niger]|uniref:Methyltransferase domain family protein n=1 Tax=Aspergillus niger TaxID=5061 RepID=A0A505I5H5_ASPNG|nr:Methyltransferase domain family protein [Aspergillus niger]
MADGATLMLRRNNLKKGFLTSSEFLSFYFRRQSVASIWTEGVFSRKSTGPSLAYVTFDGIQSRRSKYVHNSPGKGFNEPVFRTCDKKLRSLQPANTIEDPYIMGILIALAQEQWHRQSNEQHEEEAAWNTQFPRPPVAAQTEDLMTVVSVSGSLSLPLLE